MLLTDIEQKIQELKYYLPYNADDRFFEAIHTMTEITIKRNKFDCDYFQIADTIILEEIEKAEQAKLAEQHIDFNDEIESIEILDECELMDITVSRDNLFYANNILTKNSLGVAMTMDFAVALAQTEELMALKQLHGKQLKNRYGNKNDNNKFLLGIDLMLQRIYNVMDSEQKTVSNHQYDANRHQSTHPLTKQQQQPKNRFAALNN